MGYFYDRNEHVVGVVGAMRESTSAEMPCTDGNAAEQEEEEWKDWDDWEDWGEDEEDEEDATSNQSSEKSATLSTNNVQNDKIRKIIQVSSEPRASQRVYLSRDALYGWQ